MEYDINAIYADLANQHQHIRTLLRDLKECDHVHLVPMLEELNTVLGDHFSREMQAGGFYEAIGAKAAEHRNEVQMLERDHILLRSSFRGLLARAKLTSDASEPELLKEVAEVAECLYDHERRENQMVEALFRK